MQTLHGVRLVGRAHHLQRVALGVMNKPRPAASEVGHGRVGDRRLQLLHGAKVTLHRVEEIALGNGLALGSHAIPEEGMVPNLPLRAVHNKNLSSLVVERALLVGNVVLERLALGVLGHIVQVVDVSMAHRANPLLRLVVTVVVALHRLLADRGSESVSGVRKRGQDISGTGEAADKRGRADGLRKEVRDHECKGNNGACQRGAKIVPFFGAVGYR